MQDEHDRIAARFRQEADAAKISGDPELARVFRARADAEIAMREFDPCVGDQVLYNNRPAVVLDVRGTGVLFRVLLRFEDGTEKEHAWRASMSPHYGSSNTRAAQVERSFDDRTVLI